MGMSAGQARLLSITSRLSNNELRSQTITNSKLRLATESKEASQAYMEALNSTQLMYGSYAEDGTLSYQNLTANILLSYGDLKNQYSLVNSSGQIMLNGSDIKKYEASNSLTEYLYSYGIEKTDNPKYAEVLNEIFGDEYKSFMADQDNDEAADYINNTYINSFTNQTSEWIDNIDLSNSTAYNNWSDLGVGNSGFIADYINNLGQSGNIGGLLNNYLTIVSNPPEWDFGDKPLVEVPDFATLVADYNDSQCYNSVSATTAGIGHMEHNLAALIWGKNGFGTNEDTVITNSDGSITIDKTGNSNDLDYDYISLTNYKFPDTNSSENLLDALQSNTQYQAVNEMIERIQDLYCDVINYLNTNAIGSNTTELNNTRYSIDSAASVKSESELFSEWQDIYTSLSTLQEKVNAEKQSQIDAWQVEYDSFIRELEGWKNDCKTSLKYLTDAIGSIPQKEIPDKNDSRYQWYVNLYYRMGGGKTNDDGTKNSNNYKELDENLINNSEWLQFALEHGILTMEQASFSEEGSEKYPEIGTYDWVSIIYTNAADLKSQEDETAIALAEVKYKNTMTEIENKDKKYDQDLKKLDTEHNALQTEYESIKNTIDKNIERSFKAFS